MKNIKNTLITGIVLALVLCLGNIVWGSAAAHAGTLNHNNIIDDSVFDNVNTMDGPGIDNWLNSYFPQSCISTNNGFSTPALLGYSPSTGFSYGGNVSAGTVIYQAAHVYGVNPQVILSTLQKESSVVSGTATYRCQYMNTAMGYDCPDSGSCPQNPAKESGFSKQVVIATWMMKFHQQRSMGNTGWNVQVRDFPYAGNVWDNSDDPRGCYSGRMTQGVYATCPNGALSYYDGMTTIDGSPVHLDTGATAALYDYTPHFSGNQHFVDIFSGWFGSLSGSPYNASQVTQSTYPQLDPGQSTTAFVQFRNTGSFDWYDDAAGAQNVPLIHLATSHPLNRASVFSQGWLTPSRPATVFAAVYESNGTTLSSNQHMVRPGQIAKFQFSITAGATAGAGSYREFFQPVAEGTGNGGFNDVSTYFDVTVNSKPAMAWNDQSGYPTVNPGDSTTAFLKFKNTGNTIFYDDSALGSAPAGTHPLHLATKSPLNRSSDFSQGWQTPSRPATVFAAVYNGDGSLTGNQHIVGPGQIVKFQFSLTPPDGYTAGTYSEDFQPVLEGSSDGGLGTGVGGFFNITVPSVSAMKYTSVPNPAQLVSNTPGTVNVTVKNVGNTDLPGSTKLVTSNGTPFKASSWTDNTTIMTLGSTLPAMQSRVISIPVLTPDAGSRPNTSLTISFQDSNSQTIPSSTTTIPVSIAGASYTSGNVEQSGYPTLTYGQTSTVFFKYKNTGNQYWYDDTSYTSATTRNPYEVHLATNDPLNRSSIFTNSWPTPSRPAVNFAAVYESDGTTLASNQHVVQPGQVAKFQFDIKPATNANPGVYREFFQPVAEGTADGLFPKAWTFIDATLQPSIYNINGTTQSSYPTIVRGGQTSAFLTYKNNGNVAWYDDTSKSQGPAGTNPVHLATSHNLNRNSGFSSGWPTPSRPAVNFAAVYESDGTTLASNQHVVQPGQIAKFNFNLSAPSNLSPGVYREFFNPVVEGTANGVFNDAWTFFDVTVR